MSKQKTYHPLNYASRQELDIDLVVKEGSLPTDLQGYIFVNSVAGTVNHTTPAPAKWPDGQVCQEHGAPVLNGDGMVYRFDFSEAGQVRMRNRLLKPPCFYADYATRYGTDYYQKGLHFTSQGLSRTHLSLGTRNQLNTAFTPLKFGEGQATVLSANFDAGRPFLIDAESLQVIQPVGKRQEWVQSYPDKVQQIFPMIYATAHPCFDPRTQTYFAVSYQKSMPNLLFNLKRDHKLLQAVDFVSTELEKFVSWLVEKRIPVDQLGDVIQRYIPFLQQKNEEKHKREFEDHYQIPAVPLMHSEVRVMRWRGDKLNSWRVLDRKTGQPIAIHQTMHQMGITEDYIVLSDSTLKFAVDLIQSLPFGKNDRLNRLLRKMTTQLIRPYTPCFVIRRAELLKDADEVKAWRIELDIETIHFSLDYQNPEGIITMHASHNSAVCGGEWIRPYDRLATDPEQAVPADRIGLMCTMGLDITRLGKHRIDAEQGEVISSEYVCEPGDYDPGEPGERVHTWGLGLYTYHDQLSADRPVADIRHIYHQLHGLRAAELTHFIYDLYRDYNLEQRLVEPDRLLQLAKREIPRGLVRHNTVRMRLEDYYLLPRHMVLGSHVFIPRTGTPVGDPQMYGYIAALMMVGNDVEQPTAYCRELWLFDAADLAQGPICKLGHDQLAWGFSIHTTYCPEAQTADLAYRVDIKEDFDWVIEQYVADDRKEELQAFMNQEVYPHFS